MRLVPATALALLLSAGPALAHSAGRGFVMLLPTGYVIWGGALAVLVSFAAVSMRPLHRLHSAAKETVEDGGRLRHAVSLASAAVILFILWAGLRGPNDPAENILPLGVWTLWWVVIVLLHPLLGNLWAWINPFTGPHALLRDNRPPPLAYPSTLGFWPAVLTFLAFAWFQLVFPKPEDRGVLALALGLYLGVTFLMVLLFGPAQWLGRADPFAVFLRQLGAVAPLLHWRLRWPGAGLLALPALPVSGVLFVLLTLSTITFDGFANTFTWLSLAGINPLDYPGRTAMMGANTLGLLAAFAILAAAFYASVALGWGWAGKPEVFGALAGRLVYSLIPISIAYHFAHYLGDALVNLQYLALALNDPLHTGADLFGLGHMHVTASFQNTASGALALFSAQTGAIVLGHVVGVAVAHAMLADAGLPKAQLLKLELPLALGMVAYTGFGLWLLAAPAIA